MRIGILTIQVPFILGGAEMAALSLQRALQTADHQAEIISIPFKWYPPERIAQQVLACRLLDVTESSGMSIDRVIGLKFPAYLIPHPNKVLWVLHQHRTAYDLWGTEYGDLHHVPEGESARRVIHGADTELIPEARQVFTLSRNVTRRLYEFNRIESQPLYHPPPNSQRYRHIEDADFLLMPSRVNGPKRQDLVVEALFRVRSSARVCFMGAADSPGFLEKVRARAEALPTGRAVWLGTVTEDRKLELFGSCLGVIFPPYDEDYGYITLEAMLSAKPVITCTDSGGPLEFVQDGRTGIVCAPDPDELAHAIDTMWQNRTLARNYGDAARRHYSEMGLSWENVVQCLLG